MKNNGGLYDTIDLGLLTRVICHECNNLVASQQGYVNLLQRSNTDPALRTGWLEELSRINETLKRLMEGLRAQVLHYSAPDTEMLRSRIESVVDACLLLGADMPPLALDRLIGLILGLEPVILLEPRLSSSGRDRTSAQIELRFPLKEGYIDQNAWLKLEKSLLPGPEASSAAWQRALVLGLLRQHQGVFELDAEEIRVFIPSGDDPPLTSS